jgi:hypothetical protein
VDLAIEAVQGCLPSEGGGPMARRTFDVIDVTEILVHWHAGRSLNEMAGSLGVDRKTIRYPDIGITDLMPRSGLCRVVRGSPWSKGRLRHWLPA